jgi:regulator of protease activity HflC (stomatin/prohibitin superfamily)
MKKLIPTLVIVVLALALLQGFWLWFFCRFYVGPDQMAVIIAKGGKPLGSGQILADPGQKGVQAAVLGEGRHFRNPIMFEWELKPVTIVPPGKVGVVTAKVGKDLPPGEFLADEGEKGIWRRVLGPGKYRLNPYGYEVTQVDAVSVPIGYVGVITSLSGEQAPAGDFAGRNQKGVRRDILQPGLYYLNPKEFKCDVLEVGVNQVSLLGKGAGAVITKERLVGQNEAMNVLQGRALEQQLETRREYAKQSQSLSMDFLEREKAMAAQADGKKRPGARPAAPSADTVAQLSIEQVVEFPSRDGFAISLDMTVEFELPPTNIAWIFRSYGDLPAVVDKIIMPQILSVSRLKGSAYRAKDFIVGEGREKFQQDLTDSLARSLVDKQIIIHNALIRHVNVPTQILTPIQQASIAIEQDLTNKEQQNTAKKLAELNTETGMIEQRRTKVSQETEKIKAETKADQEKQVAQIQAETIRRTAEIEKQTAMIRADRSRKLGEASAQTITLVEGEKARGFELKAAAFGDPLAYSLWEFATGLNPDLRVNILTTGPGTLWTDLQRASLETLGGAKILQQPAATAPAPRLPTPAAK